MKKLTRTIILMLVFCTMMMSVSAAQLSGGDVEVMSMNGSHFCYNCHKTTSGYFYCSGLFIRYAYGTCHFQDEHGITCQVHQTRYTTGYCCGECNQTIYLYGQTNPYIEKCQHLYCDLHLIVDNQDHIHSYYHTNDSSMAGEYCLYS